MEVTQSTPKKVRPTPMVIMSQNHLFPQETEKKLLLKLKFQPNQEFLHMLTFQQAMEVKLQALN